MKSSFKIHVLISGHSILLMTFLDEQYEYKIADNFNGVRVFSVSFFNPFNTATLFGVKFPIAALAASILGTTVLNSYSTFFVRSSMLFCMFSISIFCFSAFSLLLLAFSLSSIIFVNFAFVSFSFWSKSAFFTFKLCLSSLTVFSVSMIFCKPLLI